MSINTKENPILYSAGTFLAYNIAKEYYKEQFVWCTTALNSLQQPPTSRPVNICKRLLEQILYCDRHTKEIYDNKSGILKGAKIKFDNGIINKKQYKEIRSIVSVAKYEAFFPVIYIIYSNKVKNRCIEVSQADCASDVSIEYKITDLKENEFEILNFKDILYDLIKVENKKAGE